MDLVLVQQNQILKSNLIKLLLMLRSQQIKKVMDMYKITINHLLLLLLQNQKGQLLMLRVGNQKVQQVDLELKMILGLLLLSPLSLFKRILTI